ncbi:MAG TPA: hypothetical protein VNK73_02630 [Actinomycetota bacterium]|jgi:hypothetical protein|nr:hypothetical protein [Actinomycetota bacterium]
MNVRLEDPDIGTGRAVRILAAAAVIVAAVGLLVLVRAAVGGVPDHRTVHLDNQTGLQLRVDVLDASGTLVALGTAQPRSATTITEAVDVGQHWTFVATYGGREVYRGTLARNELAVRGWTLRIPASATAELEQAGYR